MKIVIREHISLVVALFTILFATQVFFILERTVSLYEETLGDHYSMIIVSQSELDFETVKGSISDLKSLELVNPDKVLERIKTELNKENVDFLKTELPKFYRVYLNHYPNPEELLKLKSEFLNIGNVTRVENFSKSHDQIFKFLTLFKDLSNVFLIAIFIVSALLVFKEMRIWQFEHIERMQIMALFGAPLWMRSAVLFKLAIIDAFLSTFLVILTFLILDLNGWLHALFSMISLDVNIFEFLNDGFKLLLIATFLSLLLATLTIFKQKEPFK